MFAQMPLWVYRHLTGAGCTTSSDGLFASFSLASRLSKSSDMVRSPGHLGAAPCSAHPIQNFLPGTTVAIVGAIWRMARPRAALEPDVRLCVAVATRNRPSGLSSSLSRRRASRCRHRRTCCRSGQNQTSADGTLQQAIAHTRTCQFTATSRVRSCL